jgi:hypothetical protein
LGTILNSHDHFRVNGEDSNQRKGALSRRGGVIKGQQPVGSGDFALLGMSPRARLTLLSLGRRKDDDDTTTTTRQSTVPALESDRHKHGSSDSHDAEGTQAIVTTEAENEDECYLAPPVATTPRGKHLSPKSLDAETKQQNTAVLSKKPSVHAVKRELENIMMATLQNQTSLAYREHKAMLRSKAESDFYENIARSIQAREAAGIFNINQSKRNRNQVIFEGRVLKAQSKSIGSAKELIDNDDEQDDND